MTYRVLSCRRLGPVNKRGFEPTRLKAEANTTRQECNDPVDDHPGPIGCLTGQLGYQGHEEQRGLANSGWSSIHPCGTSGCPVGFPARVPTMVSSYEPRV